MASLTSGEFAGATHKRGAAFVVEHVVAALTQGLAPLLAVAQRVGIKKLGLGLCVHGLAVDGQALVDVGHLVTRQSDDALDVVQRGLGWVTEHHHVATLRFVVVDDFGVDHRQTNAVVEFIDQDQVANMQGRDHGARGNFERLEQKRAQDKHRQDHGEQACRPVQPPRLLQQGLSGGRAGVGVDLGDALTRQLSDALGLGGVGTVGGAAALGQEVDLLQHPIHAGDEHGQQEQQREVALEHAQVPSAGVRRERGQDHGGERGHQGVHQSSTCKMAKKAS